MEGKKNKTQFLVVSERATHPTEEPRKAFLGLWGLSWALEGGGILTGEKAGIPGRGLPTGQVCVCGCVCVCVWRGKQRVCAGAGEQTWKGRPHGVRHPWLSSASIYVFLQQTPNCFSEAGLFQELRVSACGILPRPVKSSSLPRVLLPGPPPLLLQGNFPLENSPPWSNEYRKSVV